MLNAARDGHRKFPNGGSTLGVQIAQYGLAPLPEPLTKEQMESIKSGVDAIFFMVGGVWRDNAGNFIYWANSRIAEIPKFPDLEGFSWKSI
jgi:hypothetical protein